MPEFDPLLYRVAVKAHSVRKAVEKDPTQNTIKLVHCVHVTRSSLYLIGLILSFIPPDIIHRNIIYWFVCPVQFLHYGRSPVPGGLLL